MSQFAVTIPVYKTDMNGFEKISFTQALKVFDKYPVILVCPDNMDTSSYKEVALQYNKAIIISNFDELFFKGIDGYNKLMLSSVFYQQFQHYEYILIYQLDCFVFRDDLDKWAQQGYDYIGAPWLHNDRRPWWTSKNKLKYTLKHYYRRFTNKENSITLGFYRVGNGGFSMRKVQTFIDIIKKFDGKERIERYRNAEENYLYAEDVFWGCEVNRYYPNIKIPSYKKALDFAFDMNPSLCYELNGNRIPFGCHAWYRYDINFWKPFIEKEGFNLS